MLAKERKPQAHSPSPRSIKHCNQPVLSQRRAQNEYSSRNERKKPNLLPAISPKRKAKAKSGARKKESKSPTSPHSDFAQRAKSEEQASEKIPSSVSRRKAEKRSTAKRSAGCLSEASSCASDERSFAAGPKLQTAVFLFVTFFFLPPKRKSKRKAKKKK